MKKFFLIVSMLFPFVAGAQEGVKVSRIWDNDYSAFPSIEKFNGKYYIAFREGKSHIFDENGIAAGKSRILVSKNGKKWESVALLAKDGYDLRDPKLSVTPDGRLMVIMGGSIYRNRNLEAQIPQVSYSSDGIHFTDPEPVVFDENITDRHEWIWRVTWNGDTGYGVTYGDHFALLKTKDGKKYDYITELDVPDFPGESTVRFLPDGRMLMMIRREKADCMGYWGVSNPPYTDWTWQKMDLHLGGPDFTVLDNGTVVVGTRYYYPHHAKTMILKGDVDGNFEEMHLLPSGGDTSYPGFITVGDELWMVYYSSHELGRAAIYLAKMPLELFK